MPKSTSGAADHLWLHFTRISETGDDELITMDRGEGAYVFDTRGRRYLDGMAGLFVSQVGHGRRELAEAAAAQAEKLAFFPLWGFAHSPAIALADRLVQLAPDGLDRVFFTSGGSEAVESAWKIARSYFLLKGEPERYKVISRNVAYHGTTLGALSITAVPGLKEPFAPMLNDATRHALNTHQSPADDPLAAADDIERIILEEGPETVAAVFLEPVQNAGGCFTAPPGYFERVREVCDRHGVLLVSDEVICAFGRLGDWFGAGRLGYRPDMLTFAKGVTSGYLPLGGVLVGDHIVEPFKEGTTSFPHGITFAGHPVSCAVALANLDVMEREDLPGRVRANEDAFRATLDSLLDLPLVREIRGMGYFWAIELGREGEPLSAAQRDWLVRTFVRHRALELGLHCRVDDRGDPVIQLSPPLTVGPAEFEEMRVILRQVLEEAWKQLPT
jgi:adenosylmethionine-8-amino-7-oxononanoate aminotransferase